MTFKSTKNDFDNGVLTKCVISPLPFAERWTINVFYHQSGLPTPLSTDRHPYPTREFKTLNQALATAFKIGFTEVIINRILDT